MAQLDRGGAGQRGAMVAGDGLVREQAEQRSDPLAARSIRIEPEVVTHHLVEGFGVRVLDSRDDAKNFGLRVGDQQVEVGRRQHRARITAGGLRSIAWNVITYTW